MAAESSRPGRKRMQKDFKVRLIPHFDPSADARQRKEIGQKIVAMMLSGLRRRGRPKKTQEDLEDVA